MLSSSLTTEQGAASWESCSGCGLLGNTSVPAYTDVQLPREWCSFMGNVSYWLTSSVSLYSHRIILTDWENHSGTSPSFEDSIHETMNAQVNTNMHFSLHPKPFFSSLMHVATVLCNILYLVCATDFNYLLLILEKRYPLISIYADFHKRICSIYVKISTCTVCIHMRKLKHLGMHYLK